MIITEETLETLKDIVKIAVSQAEDDVIRARMNFERGHDINNIYEHYKDEFDKYKKVKQFVDSSEVTE